jgi:hypothetical protein
MKTINKTFKETVKEVAQACLGIVRHVTHTLDKMSWPALVSMCVVFAIFLTILPLALTLLLGVVIVKLVISLFSGEAKHGR